MKSMKSVVVIQVCLSLALGLVSCVDRKAKRDIDKFLAKEIVVPAGMRQMVKGRDSVVIDHTAADARLIVWIDSLVCSSCRLDRMFEYDYMIDYRDETGDGFTPVFIFSPSAGMLGDVMQTVKYSQHDYPVFIDENGAFPAANPHIPADNRLHTFLLDRNGKVVLVGTPANNPQLWELYKTTIKELIKKGGTMS